jgi:tRNA A37 N6-isopentenylltransferase MiaA
MTVEQLRDNNRLVLMTTNGRHRNTVAGILEAIALTCENYDSIANMDNVAVYTTKNDKFMVIEGGSNLYATLIASNRHSAWTINENAIDALSFIKSKTNTSLGEVYASVVESCMEKVSEEEKEKMAQEIKENETLAIKDRIANLTEKFKNDPTKLAVLSKLAQELSELE